MQVSVNVRASRIVEEMIARKDEIGVSVYKVGEGTVIDAGVEALGGYLAGRCLTEVCLGGLGSASIIWKRFGEIGLPAVVVSTDHPSIALLGSQFAGWQIKVEKFIAMGSGPARALALKPKELYEKIGYRDEANTAVIVLETTQKPDEGVVEYISNACSVDSKDLYIILASTSSLAGSTQISGRIVETGLHKLVDVGLDPKLVLYGSGCAPIAPVHPRFQRAMGRTNDALLYGGETFFTVKYEDDEELRRIVEQVPSSKSRDYGRSFFETFKEAGYDFYKIDPALFAPACITVNNLKTGSAYRAGQMNEKVLKESFFGH
jgi:methenyltetrahydromethanopterin cyclohydrolase